MTVFQHYAWKGSQQLGRILHHWRILYNVTVSIFPRIKLMNNRKLFSNEFRQRDIGIKSPGSNLLTTTTQTTKGWSPLHGLKLDIFLGQVSNWVQKFCRICGKSWRGNIDVEAHWCWEIHNCNLLGPFSGQKKRSHQRCSIRKLFLKISQYSRENICVGVSFL